MTASVALAAVLGAAPATASTGNGGLSYGADGPNALVVRDAAMLHRTVNVSGTLADLGAGDPVIVQRQRDDGGWDTVARTTAAKDGSFATTWKTDHSGLATLRAVRPSSAAAEAASAGPQAIGKLTIYRSQVATYFGPGFYGSQTACGQTLTKHTLGVAHKSLPCGTLVDLYYKGRTITVPVIDRGPFRADTTWDLTQATADALGFTETGRLGALPQR